MGFGVVVSTLLMFIVIFFLAISLIGIYKESVKGTTESLKRMKTSEYEQLNSHVEILTAEYNSTSGMTELLVGNTGSITLNPQQSDVYIDKARVPRDERQIMIVNEMVNPGLWDPEETLFVETGPTLMAGDHMALIVTEYRASDVAIYSN